MGVRTYNDFTSQIAAAKQQVDARTKAAIDQIKSAEDQARAIIDTSKEVQKDIDDARRIVVQVRKLRSDVDSLQSQVEGFYKTQMRELFGGHQKEERFSRKLDRCPQQAADTSQPQGTMRGDRTIPGELPVERQ